MDRNQFESNWHMMKGHIRKKWNKFSDEEISRINGKYDQFMNELQRKYGFSREQAEKEIHNWRLEGHEREEGPTWEQRGGEERWQREEGPSTKGKEQKKHRGEEEKKRKAG